LERAMGIEPTTRSLGSLRALSMSRACSFAGSLNVIRWS